MDGLVRYDAPDGSADLEAETFELIDAQVRDGSPGLALEPAADLYVIWRGLRDSMPHLPRTGGGRAATRLVHPGYAE